MSCLVCDHIRRDKIDEALLEWEATDLNGEKPSLEALCVQLQKEYGSKGDFTFTLPDMLTHAKKCPRYKKSELPAVTEGSAITEVTIGDEVVAVPPWELVIAYIKAAGVLEIIKHPDIVRPQHLLRAMELEGGKGSMDQLMEAVQNILSRHPPDARGPMAPPRD